MLSQGVGLIEPNRCRAHVFRWDAEREAATLQERSQWSREESVKPEAVGWKTKRAAETGEDKVACGASFAAVCTAERYGMSPRAGHVTKWLKCPRFFFSL